MGLCAWVGRRGKTLLKKSHTFGQVVIAFAQSMRPFCCKNLSCELFEIKNLKFVSVVGKSSPFCSPARHHHHHHLPSHWAGFSDQPTYPNPHKSRYVCSFFFAPHLVPPPPTNEPFGEGVAARLTQLGRGSPTGGLFAVCRLVYSTEHTVCANRQRDTGRGGREIRRGDEESTMSE